MVGSHGMQDTLEIKRVTSKYQHELILFFQTIQNSDDIHFFHPHDFTPELACKIVNHEGLDVYYVLVKGQTIVGYGMLRGWDEGYETPGLALIIHPDFRGQGLGRLLMLFLHAVARLRTARQILIKVYEKNRPALNLYQSMGYCFNVQEGPQLIGFLEL